MACYDRACRCSNAPKCKCAGDWDVRCVCHPDGESTWNCPVRVNTALWLIDNDETLHTRARRRDFEGIRGWFNLEDEISYWSVIALYSLDVLDELAEEYLGNLPVQAYYPNDKTDYAWIEADMAANESEMRSEYIAWLELKKNAEKKLDTLDAP